MARFLVAFRVTLPDFYTEIRVQDWAESCLLSNDDAPGHVSDVAVSLDPEPESEEVTDSDVAHFLAHKEHAPGCMLLTPGKGSKVCNCRVPEGWPGG